MSEYLLDYTHLEAYECAAQLITMLALPVDTVDSNKRDDLHSALCHVALREMYDNLPIRYQPQLMKPVYVFRELPAVMRQMNLLGRILRGRTTAGHMAIPFAQEIALGHVPKLPPQIKRLNISQMAIGVLDMVQQNDPQNVRNRVWTPSLPVLHMCAALQIAATGFSEFAGEPLTCVDLMLNRSMIEHLVQSSEEIAAFLVKSERLKLDPASLIHFRIKT